MINSTMSPSCLPSNVTGKADRDFKVIFGGSKPWPDFSAVNDTLRGGKSTSNWSIGSSNIGTFSGHLDITALGGAGFASQSSTFPSNRLDLHPSRSSGLLLTIIPPTLPDSTPLNTLSLLPLHQPYKYVLAIKNEKPGRREDGRRESVTVYEWVLDVKDYEPYRGSSKPSGEGDIEKAEMGEKGSELITVLARWQDFHATYRGREQTDAPALDPSSIYELGFMCRSNFGDQAGDFSLDVVSLGLAPRSGRLDKLREWLALALQLAQQWKEWLMHLLGRRDGAASASAPRLVSSLCQPTASTNAILTLDHAASHRSAPLLCSHIKGTGYGAHPADQAKVVKCGKPSTIAASPLAHPYRQAASCLRVGLRMWYLIGMTFRPAAVRFSFFQDETSAPPTLLPASTPPCPFSARIPTLRPLNINVSRNPSGRAEIGGRARTLRGAQRRSHRHQPSLLSPSFVATPRSVRLSPAGVDMSADSAAAAAAQAQLAKKLVDGILSPILIAVTYYSRFASDRISFRLLVGVLTLAAMLDTGSSCGWAYTQCVTHFGDPMNLLQWPKWYTSYIFLTGFEIAVCQFFWVCSFYLSIRAIHTTTLEQYGGYRPVADSWLGISVAVDVLITGSMIFYVWWQPKHDAGFNVVAQSSPLMRVVMHALTTNLAALVVQVAFIALATCRSDLQYLLPGLSNAKVYIACVIATLNVRQSMQNGTSHSGSGETPKGLTSRFFSTHSRGAANSVQVHVQQNVEVDHHELDTFPSLNRDSPAANGGRGAGRDGTEPYAVQFVLDDRSSDAEKGNITY
ncbi:hypothetical protein JCM11641_000657 [Rhodosporidiobolus odoratus]